MHRNKWYTKLQSAKVHLVTLHFDCRHFLPLSTSPKSGLDLSFIQFKYLPPLSSCPERGLDLSLIQFKYLPPLSTCPERGLDWISHLNSSSISRPSLLVQRGVWSSLLYNSSISRPSLLVQRGVWISLLYSSSSILLQRGVGAWEFTKRMYNQKVRKCTETH